MVSSVSAPAVPLLHVDDNSNERFLLKSCLRCTTKLFGYEGVDSLQSAMAFFLSETRRPPGQAKPGVVLIDYNVGFQTARDFLYWLRVQQRDEGVPVILYSNCADVAVVRECYALGASHFLSKPHSFAGTMAVAQALRLCFSGEIPEFRYLGYLSESKPDPR